MRRHARPRSASPPRDANALAPARGFGAPLPAAAPSAAVALRMEHQQETQRKVDQAASLPEGLPRIIPALAPYLSHHELLRVGLAGPGPRRGMAAAVSDHTVEGLPTATYDRLLVTAAQGSDGRPIGETDRRTGFSATRRAGWTASVAATNDTARAHVARNYRSPLATPPARTTLNQLTDEIRPHAELTNRLRTFKPRPLPASIGWGDGGSKPDEKQAQVLRMIGGHWGRQAEYGREREPRPSDVDAHRFAEAQGLFKKGHNVSVVEDGPVRRLYSNQALSDADRDAARAGGLTPTLTHPGERAGWGPAQGIGRKVRGSGEQPWDIPLHSELQPLLEGDHETHRYAGNPYLGCAQCTAAEYALGSAAGASSRGSHAVKSPSVIPPVIRRNGVYLRHYVGHEAADAFMREPDHALAANTLELVERADKTYWEKYAGQSSSTPLAGSRMRSAFARSRSGPAQAPPGPTPRGPAPAGLPAPGPDRTARAASLPAKRPAEEAMEGTPAKRPRTTPPPAAPEPDGWGADDAFWAEVDRLSARRR